MTYQELYTVLNNAVQNEIILDQTTYSLMLAHINRAELTDMEAQELKNLLYCL